MGGVRGVGVQVAEVVHGVLEGERLQAALLAEGGVDGPPHLWRALGQVVYRRAGAQESDSEMGASPNGSSGFRCAPHSTPLQHPHLV